MAKKQKKLVITREEIISMMRAASRTVEIENGIGRIRGGAHLTSKRDVESRKSNTVKEWFND